MFCPQCGTQAADSALFCTRCGIRLKGNEVQGDSRAQSEAESANGSVRANQTAPVSHRTAEDRESLHTYIVTPISDYRSLSFKHEIATGITDVASDLVGRGVGNIIGTFAANIYGHFTNHDTEAEKLKREALFQQKGILKLGESYLEHAPWITYLVTKKCEPFLQHFGISTDSFSSLHEKAFVDELERYADELEARAIQRMPDETRANVDQIAHLQFIRSELEEAIQVISGIIHSEHRNSIEAAIRGKGVSIPSSAVNQSDGSGAESEISRQSRAFGHYVFMHLAEINIRVDDPAFSLESTQAQFRNLIERSDELKAQYTQT